MLIYTSPAISNRDVDSVFCEGPLADLHCLSLDAGIRCSLSIFSFLAFTGAGLLLPWSISFFHCRCNFTGAGQKYEPEGILKYIRETQSGILGGSGDC